MFFVLFIHPDLPWIYRCTLYECIGDAPAKPTFTLVACPYPQAATCDHRNSGMWLENLSWGTQPMIEFIIHAWLMMTWGRLESGHHQVWCWAQIWNQGGCFSVDAVSLGISIIKVNIDSQPSYLYNRNPVLWQIVFTVYWKFWKHETTVPRHQPVWYDTFIQSNQPGPPCCLKESVWRYTAPQFDQLCACRCPSTHRC